MLGVLATVAVLGLGAGAFVVAACGMPLLAAAAGFAMFGAGYGMRNNHG